MILLSTNTNTGRTERFTVTDIVLKEPLPPARISPAAAQRTTAQTIAQAERK